MSCRRVWTYRGKEELPEWCDPSELTGGNLSGSLARLVLPYSQRGMSAEARRSLVQAGVPAWNRTLPGMQLSDPEVESRLSSGSPGQRQQVLQVIRDISRRKLELFPDDLRFIVDAELREQNNGTFYLAVTLVEEDEETGGR